MRADTAVDLTIIAAIGVGAYLIYDLIKKGECQLSHLPCAIGQGICNLNQDIERPFVSVWDWLTGQSTCQTQGSGNGG